jgi:hypothetical protein
MGQLENFLHQERPERPLLISAGLAHVQFETIHPFLDGNGRLGRWLIMFLLCAGGALEEPILWLSLFFKTNRQAYHDHWMNVRTKGDWEGWMEFFLEGVKETSAQAVGAARRVIALMNSDWRKIEQIGRPSASVLGAHQYVQTHPIVSIAAAAGFGFRGDAPKTISTRLLEALPQAGEGWDSSRQTISCGLRRGRGSGWVMRRHRHRCAPIPDCRATGR